MTRRAQPLVVVAAVVVGLVAPAAGRPRSRHGRRPSPPKVGTVVHDHVAGGDHWRVVTEHGPVHVWRPRSYRAVDASVVLYVHGYYTGVDAAWRDQALADKFAASRRNALFIVPEAPSGNRQPVFFPSLGELITEVRRWTGVARPGGEVVALGHSGAFRTLLGWLDYPLLDEVVLIDALYGHEDEFTDWLDRPRARDARLIVVAADTLRWSEAMARDAGADIDRDEVPASVHDLPDDGQRARLIYLRSGLGHMDLVEGKATIPLLLQLTGVAALP